VRDDARAVGLTRTQRTSPAGTTSPSTTRSRSSPSSRRCPKGASDRPNELTFSSLVAVEADYFNDVSKKEDGTYDQRITLLTRDVQVLMSPKKDSDASAPREIH